MFLLSFFFLLLTREMQVKVGKRLGYQVVLKHVIQSGY